MLLVGAILKLLQSNFKLELKAGRNRLNLKPVGKEGEKPGRLSAVVIVAFTVIIIYIVLRQF